MAEGKAGLEVGAAGAAWMVAVAGEKMGETEVAEGGTVEEMGVGAVPDHDSHSLMHTFQLDTWQLAKSFGKSTLARHRCNRPCPSMASDQCSLSCNQSMRSRWVRSM